MTQSKGLGDAAAEALASSCAAIDMDVRAATFLDVAVLRCLFVPQWQEEGIHWALQFLYHRYPDFHAKFIYLLFYNFRNIWFHNIFKDSILLILLGARIYKTCSDSDYSYRCHELHRIFNFEQASCLIKLF